MVSTSGERHRGQGPRLAFVFWAALILLLAATGVGVALQRRQPAPAKDEVDAGPPGELLIPAVPAPGLSDLRRVQPPPAGDPHAARDPRHQSRQAKTAGAPAPDFSRLLESKVNPADYAPCKEGQGFRATNAIQNLSLRFDSAGVAIEAPTKDKAATNHVPPKESAPFVMCTTAWGRAGAMRPLEAVAPKQDGARVVYPRAGLTEWYENRAGGLEQGFTVFERPAGQGDLRIELSLTGARAALNGTRVRLQTNPGRVFSLDKLLVKDAAGHDVPAKFEAQGKENIVLTVDDLAAPYPMFIDPTLADDGWQDGLGISGTNSARAIAINKATGDVYVGGCLMAGDKAVNNVAKWNGSSWSPLGTGFNSVVNALAVDASGNVYAGGGSTDRYISKWDGSNWTDLLGTGLGAMALKEWL